jgi:hypothetical protein
MNKENVIRMHDGVLFYHKEEWNYVVFRKMGGTGNLHVKGTKPDSQRQVLLYVFFHM